MKNLRKEKSMEKVATMEPLKKTNIKKKKKNPDSMNGLNAGYEENGKQKTKKLKMRWLWLLNPNNLAKEIHVYGYDFSWLTHALFVIGSVIGISAIGLLYKLKPEYLIIAIIVAIVLIPACVEQIYKQMFEQKRFADALEYMEQMLYSFQKTGKILSSLQETQRAFKDGNMKDCIDKAIEHITNGKTFNENGVLEKEALEMIEEKYMCDKIVTMHDLLYNSENTGGDNNNSILLMLEDIENWKKRGYTLLAAKKSAHNDNIISIGFASIITLMVLYLLDYTNSLYGEMASSTSIFDITITQVSSLAFILCMYFVLVKSFKMQTDSPLNGINSMTEKEMLRDYEFVVNYDESKQKKKSLFYAAPFAAGTVVALCYQKNTIAILLLVLAAFLLRQHKVGYNIAKKSVEKGLYASISQWFMQMSLLLQHNNVQVSLAKSMQNAPAIIQKELEKLMERLEKDPNSIDSYVSFFKEFDAPEIQSCMKMLYSISENGVGNSDQQIKNLIDSVNKLQSKADELNNESIAFKMKMIFSYPVAFASLKLMLDMTVGLFFILQVLSQIAN